jgi:ribonucleoside-diphosphate reductase beta chain
MASERQVGIVAVPSNPPPVSVALRELGPTLTWLALGLLVLGATLTALFVFRPVHKRIRSLEHAARALGDGRTDVRATESGGDEVSSLARTFNRMAEDLESRATALAASDRARRQLLADVSHELMTPLSAIRGYVETLGMPDSEFTAFMDYQAMRDKHDYLQGFGVDTHADVLRTLAMFGGFTEGLQLFASFAILLNFPRHGKMRGMGQVVSWSVRDETLHCEGIIRLFHSFAQETGALTPAVRDDIVDCARTVVTLEDRFVDLAFEMGPVEGLSAAGVKAYIRYIADWRLKQLGLPQVYGVKEHPLPWLTEILNGVEHANFFETRATEYAKAATGGAWHGAEGAWGLFDRRVARRGQLDLIGGRDAN